MIDEESDDTSSVAVAVRRRLKPQIGPAENSLADARAAARKVLQSVNEPIPYAIDVEEIKRMAGQFMTLSQIAARLSLPIPLFKDLCARFPQIRAAYEMGMAESIDRTTAVLQQAREAGDIQAVKFTLERKGGWNMPKDGPAVVINTGEGITIDGSHVDELRDRQRRFAEIPDAELAD